MIETVKPKCPRYCTTPDRLVVGLFGVEGLLWLSNRLQLPVWHKGYAVLATVAAVGAFLVLMLGWWAIALAFRVRLQFSLRSLLMLVLAVALPCGWMSREIKQAREQKKTVDGYGDWITHTKRDWHIDGGEVLRNPRPPEPEWLRAVLGPDFFDSIVLVSFLGNRIDDETVREVQQFRQLRWLDLHDEFAPHDGISDASLAYLEGLTQLQWLDIGNTHVTDAGLVHLTKLPMLRELRLNGTQVTDAGLEHLKGFTELRRLWLYSTRVTDESVRNLQQALPNCKIER